jgi:biotin synthase
MIKARNFSDSELALYIEDDSFRQDLAQKADVVRREVYSDKVFVRGLIEFSNYCKNDCYYCGIRKSNKKVKRYRLEKEQILACADLGYKLGYRTFVLQSGEDLYFTDEKIADIVEGIKNKYPDCAVTLSLGERSRQSYQRFFDAGCDRYLLREETSSKDHYQKLHPASMSFEKRRQALWDLKEIGFQVGGGFMVGSPYQKTEDIIKDIRFLEELEPDMIGIGPYLVEKDTPFGSFSNGSYEKTLRVLSLVRLIFPYALLPATTALSSIDPQGREMGLKSGANVLMPNLSPQDVRAYYSLYDNKISSGLEAAEAKKDLEERVKKAGYRIVTDRGDVTSYKNTIIKENNKENLGKNI